MVSVELAVLAPGVMAAGENAQVRPLGSPLQESEIELLNAPDWGSATTVRFPDWPAEIVSDDGAALNDTVAGVVTGHVEL